MAKPTNNYGMSPGVCCRTGKTIYNKISCQSLRMYPAPPGFWEQEFNIPIRETGPEARKKWDDIARSWMFSDSKFVPCRHPDCWICMGQESHPTAEQIAIFNPPAPIKRFSLGILENEEYLFAEPVRHSKFKQFIIYIKLVQKHYMRTEPWWVCSTCNKKLCKTKQGKLNKVMTEHRKTCSYYAGGQIKQLKQGS